MHSSPSPSGTSLRGQILSEDDLSFCRLQSLLPDCNPMGDGTYGGGAKATISDFPSDPITSGPSLMTSSVSELPFPMTSLLEVRGSREGQGDLLFQTLPKGL